MDHKQLYVRLFAIALSIMLFSVAMALLAIAATASSSDSENIATSALGIVARGNVTVGNASAPQARLSYQAIK